MGNSPPRGERKFQEDEVRGAGIRGYAPASSFYARPSPPTHTHRRPGSRAPLNMRCTHRGEQSSFFVAGWRQPGSIFTMCSCESNKDYYSAIEVVEETLERETRNAAEMAGISVQPSHSEEDLRALAQLPSLNKYNLQGVSASK